MYVILSKRVEAKEYCGELLFFNLKYNIMKYISWRIELNILFMGGLVIFGIRQVENLPL